MSSSNRHSDIDALRTFAMLAVVGIHTKILPIGWMGVWLFFVISGFVVTESILKSETKGNKEWLKAFYRRRALRIVPIYMLYLFFGFLVSACLSGEWEYRELLFAALFFNNFGALLGHGNFAAFPIDHLWSVSIEMHFYLIFGMMWYFFDRIRIRNYLLAWIILTPFVRLAMSSVSGYPEVDISVAAGSIYFPSFCHFDSFALGAFFALIRGSYPEKFLANRILSLGVILFLVYCLAYAGVNHFIQARTGVDILRDIVSGNLYGQYREVFLYSVIAILSLGVIAVSISGSSPWAALTRSRVIRRMGETSYGSYLFHTAFIRIADLWLAQFYGPDPFPILVRVAIFFFAAACSIALAEISFRFFEKPIANYFRERKK